MLEFSLSTLSFYLKFFSCIDDETGCERCLSCSHLSLRVYYLSHCQNCSYSNYMFSVVPHAYLLLVFPTDCSFNQCLRSASVYNLLLVLNWVQGKWFFVINCASVVCIIFEHKQEWTLTDEFQLWNEKCGGGWGGVLNLKLCLLLFWWAYLFISWSSFSKSQ